jgi:DNA-directed RNA polymerase II subunit RPB1
VTTTLKILKCICFYCARLKLRDDKLREQIERKPSARTRFKHTFDACSKLRECRSIKDTGIGCGNIQPKYTREGLIIYKTIDERQMSMSGSCDPKSSLKAIDVLKLFERIPDEELRLLGMDPKHARPAWMIIQELAVAPPPVRPSVDSGGGGSSNDDLTVAYQQVIRKSNELRKLQSQQQ